MEYPFARAAIRGMAAGLAVAVAVGAASASDFRLLMFEQAGCIYCMRWDSEIGPAYPNTEQGEIAPLTKLNIRDELPDGIELDRAAYLTPTFVLIREGAEVGRIEGYPGPDFFWFLLDEVIERAEQPES